MSRPGGYIFVSTPRAVIYYSRYHNKLHTKVDLTLTISTINQHTQFLLSGKKLIMTIMISNKKKTEIMFVYLVTSDTPRLFAACVASFMRGSLYNRLNTTLNEEWATLLF